MNWIFGNYVRGRGAAGLLIVRLVFGLGIMLHGWQKIQSPFDWMGAHAPVPGIFQGLSALAEFGGGLGIILGLLTPLAALGLTCNMLVALFKVHLKNGDPFVAGHAGAPLDGVLGVISRQLDALHLLGGNGGHSFEPAAGYLAVALLLLLTGPGSWSLDALLLRPMFGKREAD